MDPVVFGWFDPCGDADRHNAEMKRRREQQAIADEVHDRIPVYEAAIKRSQEDVEREIEAAIAAQKRYDEALERLERERFRWWNPWTW